MFYKFRKIIAIILTAAFFISVLPVTAIAETASELSSSFLSLTKSTVTSGTMDNGFT